MFDGLWYDVQAEEEEEYLCCKNSLENVYFVRCTCKKNVSVRNDGIKNAKLEQTFLFFCRAVTWGMGKSIKNKRELFQVRKVKQHITMTMTHPDDSCCCCNGIACGCCRQQGTK